MENIKKEKTFFILLGIFYLIFGLCLIIWPGQSVSTICIILGIACIVFGIYMLYRYFANGLVIFRLALSTGIISILLGIVLVSHPKAVVSIFNIILGFYIIIDSVIKLQSSIEVRHIPGLSGGLMMVLSIISMVLGVLLIFDPFSTSKALAIFIGVTFIIDGIQNIYSGIYISKHAADIEPIEAKFRDIM
ncbi:MAG: HdeD family acid-resistance protein [Oscillospiraceae bacterium]|jgi:uncharacterized membrane protein HdeD (DUF308 family)